MQKPIYIMCQFKSEQRSLSQDPLEIKKTKLKNWINNDLTFDKHFMFSDNNLWFTISFWVAKFTCRLYKPAGSWILAGSFVVWSSFCPDIGDERRQISNHWNWFFTFIGSIRCEWWIICEGLNMYLNIWLVLYLKVSQGPTVLLFVSENCPKLYSPKTSFWIIINVRLLNVSDVT